MGLQERSLQDSTPSGEKGQFAVVVCSVGCGCGPRPTGEGWRKDGAADGSRIKKSGDIGAACEGYNKRQIKANTVQRVKVYIKHTI